MASAMGGVIGWMSEIRGFFMMSWMDIREGGSDGRRAGGRRKCLGMLVNGNRCEDLGRYEVVCKLGCGSGALVMGLGEV